MDSEIESGILYSLGLWAFLMAQGDNHEYYLLDPIPGLQGAEGNEEQEER